MILNSSRLALCSSVLCLFASCAVAAPPKTAAKIVAALTVRLAEVAKITPGRAAEFESIAANLPPEVAQAVKRHGFCNQMIFVKELSESEPWAFRYLEYNGGHLAEDLASLSVEPGIQQWQKSLDACLAEPWGDAAEAFHTDGRSDRAIEASAVKRFGQVVGIRPEMIPPYRLLHTHAWPEVLAKITEGNIRNYSIYLAGDGEKAYLFAYFEYVGADFDGDMKAVDGDAATQAWMKFTDQACQLPIPTRAAGEWWANMKTVQSWQVDGGHDN